MRTIETHQAIPLSAVKPLEQLRQYRAYCVEATRQAVRSDGHRVRRRERSPVGGAVLEPYGEMEGLSYSRCPETGSVFLAELPTAPTWGRLLVDVSRYRHKPETFHTDLAQSRSDAVYAPKLEWIHDTLRLHGLTHPRVLEVVTPPSHFTTLLRDSRAFAEVAVVDEMELASTTAAVNEHQSQAQAAILLESLDRVDDPAALVCGVARRLAGGGLLFVTALVASGFDVQVLGTRNWYLYPPDRANCFSLRGLERLLTDAGFSLMEVSTPGVLDVEILQNHVCRDPGLPLSAFERQLLAADAQTREAFQTFLQQHRMSSFARIIGRKQS